MPGFGAGLRRNRADDDIEIGRHRNQGRRTTKSGISKSGTEDHRNREIGHLEIGDGGPSTSKSGTEGIEIRHRNQGRRTTKSGISKLGRTKSGTEDEIGGTKSGTKTKSGTDQRRNRGRRKVLRNDEWALELTVVSCQIGDPWSSMLLRDPPIDPRGGSAVGNHVIRTTVSGVNADGRGMDHRSTAPLGYGGANREGGHASARQEAQVMVVPCLTERLEPCVSSGAREPSDPRCGAGFEHLGYVPWPLSGTAPGVVQTHRNHSWTCAPLRRRSAASSQPSSGRTPCGTRPAAPQGSNRGPYTIAVGPGVLSMC
jgi:hypothetical protein